MRVSVDGRVTAREPAKESRLVSDARTRVVDDPHPSLVQINHELSQQQFLDARSSAVPCTHSGESLLAPRGR
jgi:hypothetical protein